MIDKSFLEKVEQMSKTEILEVDGRPYSSKGIMCVLTPQPAPLKVKTLTAIEDYLKANVDALTSEQLILHVVNQEKVLLWGKLMKPFEQRNVYLESTLSPRNFPFGIYHDIENFIIELQTAFVQTETTAHMIKLVGNISDELVTNFGDDGVSQKVTTRVGITKVENVKVPSPVILQPYRTFLEVEQPASAFIFRMKSTQGGPPLCALFEADGGQWELVAMKRVSEWLKGRSPAGITILA